MGITMDVKIYGKKSWSQSFRDRVIHKRKKAILKNLQKAETGMQAVAMQFPHTPSDFRSLGCGGVAGLKAAFRATANHPQGARP